MRFFEKGKFAAVDEKFRFEGLEILQGITKFQIACRSIQSVSTTDLIVDAGFVVVCPPDKDKADLLNCLASYSQRLAKFIDLSELKSVSDYS